MPMKGSPVSLIILVLLVFWVQSHAEPTTPTRDPYGVTPLMKAVYDGDEVAVRRLLKEGTDVSAETKYGITALLYATSAGHTKITALLLEAGASPDVRMGLNETPLIQSVSIGNVDAARLLLEHGADVNEATMQELTPLMIAARDGHLELVHLLIDKGAEVDTKVADRPFMGYSAWVFAKRNKHQQILDLIEKTLGLK